MDTNPNTLSVIVSNSNLPQEKKDYILAQFAEFSTIASEWETKAKSIVVTSVDQVEDMKIAREGRLFLQKKRTTIEKIRKDLKEQSLREGKAIDGVANFLKNLIEPIESYLGKQERFAEEQELKRRDALRTTRALKLKAIGPNVDPGIYDLVGMPEDVFQALVAAKEKEVADAALALELAEKKRKDDEVEAARLREENQRLQIESAKREEEVRKQNAEREAETRRLNEIKEAELREQRRIQEEALQAERDARSKAEKELAEKNRQEQEIAQAEAKKAEALRLAPDKEKLNGLACQIEVLVFPEVTSEDAKQILDDCGSMLQDVVLRLRSM